MNEVHPATDNAEPDLVYMPYESTEIDAVDSYSRYELRVHAVLRDWFNALEDGSASYRMPDPDYARPPGKAPWTEEDLERLIREVDEYVWQQKSWAQGTHHKDYDAGPGFDRLAPAQRLAFAQDLERALGAPLHVG